MKIRNGFVSNSSSSSFLIDKIPDSLVIDKSSFANLSKEILSYVAEYDGPGFEDDQCPYPLDENTYELHDKIIPLFNNALNQLKNGEDVTAGHDIDKSLFWGLKGFLDVNNLVIDSFPGHGGDGEHCLLPLKDKRKGKKQ